MKKAVSNFEAAFLFAIYFRTAVRLLGLPTFLFGVSLRARLSLLAFFSGEKTAKKVLKHTALSFTQIELILKNES
ncbi:MAG: hypothetical protein Q8K04_01100 [Lutibacter sp.]|jgi:hypothetical protein|nr:hypothetical protein [Lutibacter sp.]MDP3945994.1 hypothetical protein [Lutibacter sp.]